jgi:four helix bundle protein
MAYRLAMEIFKESKKYPKEEVYSLTDQIRRSSRSVVANIAEGFRKRRYPNMFISKMADSDSEVAETQVWLDPFGAAQDQPLPTACLPVGRAGRLSVRLSSRRSYTPGFRLGCESYRPGSRMG